MWQCRNVSGVLGGGGVQPGSASANDHGHAVRRQKGAEDARKKKQEMVLHHNRTEQSCAGKCCREIHAKEEKVCC